MRPCARHGHLPRPGGHRLYWERHGREGGEPVFFLHGGPGGCASQHHLVFFDLDRFDIILFDQRGAGRSTPHGERRCNTTANTIEDIDALRQYFDFAQITLLGISWGSWLALQYAWHTPARVRRLVLASLFVPYPENRATYHQRLMGYLNASGFTAFKQLWRDLQHPCRHRQRSAALAWARAGLRLNQQQMGAQALERFIDAAAVRAIRLELHYHRAAYFFSAQDQALRLDATVQVVQGINDAMGLCSLRWLRGRAPLQCQLFKAGHDVFHPSLSRAIQHSLVQVSA